MLGIKEESKQNTSNDIAALKSAAKDVLNEKKDIEKDENKEIVPVDALIDLDPWLTPFREPLQKR